MKIIKQMALGLFIASISVGAVQAADGKTSVSKLKIGVVNVPKVLAESPQAEAVRLKLQGEFEPREKELMKEQNKMRDLDEKLKRDGAVMSESERAKVERELMALSREAKRKQDDMRDDFTLRRGELLEDLQRDLGDSIRAFAEKEKYDVLLGEGVIYVKDNLDITDKVLDYLRK